MVKRVVLVAVLGLVPTAVTSAAAEATGPVLTLPMRVQLVQGQPPPPVPARLSFAGLLGACGGAVSFTWDGGPWASVLPAGSGLTACDASVAAAPPAGTPAGAHQVCAANDAASACGSLTVTIQGTPPTSTPARPAAAVTPTPSPHPSPSPSGSPSPSPGALARGGPAPTSEDLPLTPAARVPAAPPTVDPKRRASVGPVSSTAMLIALVVLLAALAGTLLSLRSLFHVDQTMQRVARK